MPFRSGRRAAVSSSITISPPSGRSRAWPGAPRSLIADGVHLWVQDRGGPGTPLLLIMGANAAGVAWPDGFVERLGAHHRVIHYDHRDTGRSSWAYDEHPYAIADLAGDVVAVLVTIAGMGHALSHTVIDPVADAILAHTTAVDGTEPPRS